MVRHPCRYGINTPTHDELAANRMSLEQMRTVIGADSLEFLPLETLRELSANPNRYCYACWDGNYPLRQ
jgi:amidophosphoribosyltransferase